MTILFSITKLHNCDLHLEISYVMEKTRKSYDTPSTTWNVILTTKPPIKTVFRWRDLLKRTLTWLYTFKKRKVEDNSTSGTEMTIVPTCSSSTHSFAECFESPQAVMPYLVQEIHSKKWWRNIKICRTRYYIIVKTAFYRNRIMYYNGLFEMDYSANTWTTLC